MATEKPKRPSPEGKKPEGSVPPIVADRLRYVKRLENEVRHEKWLRKAGEIKAKIGQQGPVNTLPEAFYLMGLTPQEAEREFLSHVEGMEAEPTQFVKNALLAYHGWRKKNPYGIHTPE